MTETQKTREKKRSKREERVAGWLRQEGGVFRMKSSSCFKSFHTAKYYVGSHFVCSSE